MSKKYTVEYSYYSIDGLSFDIGNARLKTYTVYSSTHYSIFKALDSFPFFDVWCRDEEFLASYNIIRYLDDNYATVTRIKRL